jgi:peptidoglycan hydrolase-like protein with peptidoglycan-binding domain
MLHALGYLAAGPSDVQDAEMDSAVRAFQQDEGLATDGQAGPQTRAKLFARYMDLLCGPDLRLSKTADFLARGGDAGGKGDYQGCSEFNPVLMFSSAENEELNQPERLAERNAQNAPNRRVLALLFAPGDRVDSALWPCPRAAEGSAGCRKRFWSDAAARRSFQEQRRLYEVTRDTFACRFYHLLVDGSPCERALAVLRVRLHDRFGRKMPGVQYEVEYAGRTRPGRADAQGFLTETLDPAAEQCTIRWEPAAGENATDGAAQPGSTTQGSPAQSTAGSGSGFLHELTVFVPLLDIDTDEGVKRRLHNLGYPFDGDYETNLRAFQAHHELDITGLADDATKAELRSIYAPALDQWVEPENPGPPSVPETEQRT